MHRDIFLAGANMAFIARKTHECFKARGESDQDFLLQHCKETSGYSYQKSALLERATAQEVIDHALRIGFSAWRKQATEEERKLLPDGELPIDAQHLLLGYLPIAPSDYGNPEFIGALERCATYYLTF